MGHLEVPGQLRLGRNAGLLEEDRHTAPHLHVTNKSLAVQEHLFSLYVVGHMALVVYSPGVVPGAGPLAAPPRDEQVLQSLVLDLLGDHSYETLHHRHEPLFRHVLLPERLE